MSMEDALLYQQKVGLSLENFIMNVANKIRFTVSNILSYNVF